MREHADIRAVLPQRYPLLLVDKVLELVPGESIRTIKAITGTEPCFAELPEHTGTDGYHYPRSLMVESLGQTAALLWFGSIDPAETGPPDPDDDRVLMFVGARNLVFEGTAGPGDVLRHEVRLDSVIADTAIASGETWVGQRRIATVDSLIATRRPVAGGATGRPDRVRPAHPTTATDAGHTTEEGSR